MTKKKFGLMRRLFSEERCARRKLLISLCGISSVALTGFAEKTMPNILFIAVDDLRPELGCYGNSRILSPNIDQFAASGTLFTRAYSQVSQCGPSRDSVLSGLRPDTSGVYVNTDHFRNRFPNAVTLPQYFEKHGYRTVRTGKIFHDNHDPQSWQVNLNEWGDPRVSKYNSPENKAHFKKALETIAQKKAEGEALTPYEAYKLMITAASESADVPDTAYPDGVNAELAIQELEKMTQSDQPVFLAVGFHKPHLPFNAPRKYWDLYEKDSISLPENNDWPENFVQIAMYNWGELRDYGDIPDEGPLSDAEALRLIHGYYACVSFVDAQIGKVLDKLDELGLAENTIVIVWGDHGFHLGENGIWTKQTCFEAANHSPMIIRAPGLPANQQVHALTELLDIYPTLCDLAGLPVPEFVDGESMKPLLIDPDAPWKAAALSQFQRGKIMGKSIRLDALRFTVWEHMETGTVQGLELYDHMKDPGETTNLVNDPAIKTLKPKLNRIWSDGNPIQ
jgi:iduronate 2-sulfatase